jgi:endo-1,4-beta-xylanase
LLRPAMATPKEALLGASVFDPATTPLKSLAAAKGFLYGCSVTPGDLGDQEFKDIVVEQCDVLAPGLQLKWDVLRPTPLTFDFGPGDQLYRFTQEHDMKYRGHTLVWFSALPAWFKGYATEQNAKQLLLTHIDTVVGHYAGKMHSWDVINEALLPSDNRSDGLRISPWLQLIGPDYIEMAFRAAAQADPRAILCWNEFGIEDESMGNQEKRKFFLQNLRRLKQLDVPIGAIGIQSHLDASSANFPGPRFDDFLHDVSEMGLKILITELDFTDSLPSTDVAKRNQLIASRYEQYLDLVLKHHSVIAVLNWGISDKHTWLNGGYRFPRKDHQPFLPLPYDAHYQAKPAWYAMARAFDDAPSR